MIFLSGAQGFLSLCNVRAGVSFTLAGVSPSGEALATGAAAHMHGAPKTCGASTAVDAFALVLGTSWRIRTALWTRSPAYRTEFENP